MKLIRRMSMVEVKVDRYFPSNYKKIRLSGKTAETSTSWANHISYIREHSKSRVFNYLKPDSLPRWRLQTEHRKHSRWNILVLARITKSFFEKTASQDAHRVLYNLKTFTSGIHFFKKDEPKNSLFLALRWLQS